MTVGEEFFTVDSLGTIAVASTVIIVVTNTVRRVFGLGHIAVPFVVSLIVCFGVAAQADKLGSFLEIAVAVFNACLLFCTATGAQETLIDGLKGRPEGDTKRHSVRSLPWASSWLRPDIR